MVKKSGQISDHTLTTLANKNLIFLKKKLFKNLDYMVRLEGLEPSAS